MSQLMEVWLADGINHRAVGPVPYYAESGHLLLAFGLRGLRDAHEAGWALAFDDGYFADVRAGLAADEHGRQLKKVLPKLAEAERALNAVRLQVKRLDLEREEATDKLSGEKLTVRIGQIANEQAALRERLAASDEGLRQLREEADLIEQKLRGYFVGHCYRAAERKLAGLRGLREQLAEDMQTMPLAAALEKYEVAKSEADALRNEPLCERKASFLLDEFIAALRA